jgi:hypothetical protein
MQRRLPLAAQSVRRNDDLPSAELDLAVAAPAGLLLGGWYRDAEGLLDEMLLHRSEGEPTPVLERLENFPALLPAGSNGDVKRATGFAALIPGYAGGAPVLQPRLELKLKSGTVLSLRPNAAGGRRRYPRPGAGCDPAAAPDRADAGADHRARARRLPGGVA